MCSCHSIPECCVMFSGVKLRMGSFVLFGIRGDRTQHVLWRIQNGEIPLNAESVVIHCGTNNLGKDSLAEIKKGITSVAYAVLKRKPCVNIIVTGFTKTSTFKYPGLTNGLNIGVTILRRKTCYS